MNSRVLLCRLVRVRVRIVSRVHQVTPRASTPDQARRRRRAAPAKGSGHGLQPGGFWNKQDCVSLPIECPIAIERGRSPRASSRTSSCWTCRAASPARTRASTKRSRTPREAIAAWIEAAIDASEPVHSTGRSRCAPFEPEVPGPGSRHWWKSMPAYSTRRPSASTSRCHGEYGSPRRRRRALQVETHSADHRPAGAVGEVMRAAIVFTRRGPRR